MKLGERINYFDNETNCTLREFNQLFKIDTELKYSLNSLVEILEPRRGSKRNILIEGDTLTVSFFKQDSYIYEPYTSRKVKYGR